MPLHTSLRPTPGWFAPLLVTSALLGSSTAVSAAQVGSSQGVNFGQALINNACTVTTGDGSIGVRTNRSLITSDSAEGGNFNGTLAAASVSAQSNLTETAFLKVDNATLNGGTVPSSSQIKLGISGGVWGSSGEVNLGSDGTLASTPVHVRFSTTNNNNRFANGTYTASATVSCYDGP